jgi:trk system potassium uptake protein TrkH
MLKLISYQNILHVLGIALIFESIFMLLTIPISIFYHEHILGSQILSFAITAGVGLMLFLLTLKKHSSKFSIRESFIVIPHLWLIIPLFGTLPYLLSHAIPNFVNAFFESVSGFTTTGSSILIDIEALPKSILFWRASTHWLGGLGIIVLVVAIMRQLKIGGNHLMSAEGSLFSIEKIKPRLIDVAKQLWLIYIALTVLETLFLFIAGMNIFDAVCHSFATIATGGFSTKNTSIMQMNPTIQYILSLFMILSGINFSLHYFAMHRQFNKIKIDEEFKAYLAIIGITTLLLTLNTLKSYSSIEESFRHSLFQASSIITCTGFSSADYELWPSFSHIIIFFVMFIGASVGSTGGGIKVARIVIIFKTAKQIFARMISPNTVKITRFNGQKLNTTIINSVFAFVSIYVITVIVGTAIMSAAGSDISTSAGSILTTLGGIGPGFGSVGPAENFFHLNNFSKIYLSLNMILGRLEIFSVLVLFHPSFRKI